MLDLTDSTIDPSRLQSLRDGTLGAEDARRLTDVLARFVERDPRYRVARQLEARVHFADGSGAPTARGLILDVEATGLDRTQDRIVELGMLAFEYEPRSGRVLRVLDVFDELEDPGMPIPGASTAVHGICDEMVRGKRIDDALVEELVSDAAIVIAHNAEYDRAMVEKRFGCFSELPWACSAREIPWRDLGFASNALGHLALASGIFFEAHRAVVDCRALLEVLARPLPADTGPAGQPALASLLTRAARADFKLWALQSPFDRKDLLKARGYRWYSGEEGGLKAWALHFPSDPTRLEEECQWLRREVYKAPMRLRLDTVDARTRYTERTALSEWIRVE